MRIKPNDLSVEFSLPFKIFKQMINGITSHIRPNDLSVEFSIAVQSN